MANKSKPSTPTNLSSPPKDYAVFGRTVYDTLMETFREAKKKGATSITAKQVTDILDNAIVASQVPPRASTEMLSEGPGAPLFLGDNQDESDDFDPAKYWADQGITGGNR